MQVYCTKSRFFIVYFFTKSLFLKCKCCTKTRFWGIGGMNGRRERKLSEVGDKKIAPKDDFFISFGLLTVILFLYRVGNIKYYIHVL